MDKPTSPYLDLVSQLEAELDSTGFAPEKRPPGREPSLPDRAIRDLSVGEVKDLYDKFLAFHSYLSYQLTRCLVYLNTTEANARVVRAQVVVDATADKRNTNSELREAAVVLDKGYQKADADRLYFRALCDTHEERRRNVSKIMERLARELALREGNRWHDRPPAEPKDPHAFRPLADDRRQ